MVRKKWSDLSTGQKRGIALSGAVQIGLLIAALTDIHRRPAGEIRGSKWVWTAASFSNFAGPSPTSRSGAEECHDPFDTRCGRLGSHDGKSRLARPARQASSLHRRVGRPSLPRHRFAR